MKESSMPIRIHLQGMVNAENSELPNTYEGEKSRFYDISLRPSMLIPIKLLFLI